MWKKLGRKVSRYKVVAVLQRAEFLTILVLAIRQGNHTSKIGEENLVLSTQENSHLEEKGWNKTFSDKNNLLLTDSVEGL